jgi:hypothetical protein
MFVSQAEFQDSNHGHTVTFEAYDTWLIKKEKKKAQQEANIN